MFIHFAFASLKDNTVQQTNAVIQNILAQKRLKFSKNPEFIPVCQPNIHPRFKGKQVYHIALESFKQSEKEGVLANLQDLKFIRPESDIHYLPFEIGMICFIKISLKQLGKSPHSFEYGRLGLAFTDRFLNHNGIKAVHYFEEASLFTDPLVVKWNLKFAYRPNLSQKDQKEKKELETQILAYRKPATLFKSFRESRMLAITNTESEMNMKIVDVYDRYPTEYNFQEEKEWRIVSYDEEVLGFSENDLYMVIVPNDQSRMTLSNYFESEWKETPRVCVYPSN